MLMKDGQIVATNIKELTTSQYNALSTAQKNNGNIYAISDYTSDEYAKLTRIGNLVGNPDRLVDYADGTIIGAIADLYNRLNGISFNVDTTTNEIELNYDATPPTPVTPIDPSTMTDDEKIDYLEDLVGDPDDLAALGFTNAAAAIRWLYAKLGGCEISYNDQTDTVTLVYNSTNPK